MTTSDNDVFNNDNDSGDDTDDSSRDDTPDDGNSDVFLSLKWEDG